LSTALAQVPTADATRLLYERHSSRIFGFCLSLYLTVLKLRGPASTIKTWVEWDRAFPGGVGISVPLPHP